MSRSLMTRRDIYAGLLMVGFGLVAVLEGYRLGSGTLQDMGPGYVPVLLGCLLCGLGLVIMGSAAGQHVRTEPILDHPEWRGWLCIIGGAISFIVLGAYVGLVPASLCIVFITAMGDRTATVKGSLVLAALVTLFGVVLFSYLLKLSIPLFYGWR